MKKTTLRLISTLTLTALILMALTFSMTSIAFADDETPPVEPEAPMLLLAAPQGQAGTTLTAYKTATGHWVREFEWEIEKSVSPASWDLFTGDSGTSQYTIDVTKDSGTDSIYVDGQVCVTNGGAVATENLTIWDDILYKTGGGAFQVLLSFQVDVSGNPVLDPGEAGCYSYSQAFAPVAGATYKNSARITIINHSGSLGTPKGPSPDAAFSLPATPTLINDSINVDDSNGSSWPFNASGSTSYNKTFTCGEDEGLHGNTATIRETGQSDDASVNVNCYALTVTKDASTSFDRKYAWSIEKSADQSSVLLALNQSYLVNYTVIADMTGFTDSNWAVTGTITVANPAPMAATLTTVSDLVSPDIAATVECPALTVPAGGQLVCNYSTNLPDAASRTNTATATLQNTPSGTTDFSGSANVSFASAEMNPIDECIHVTDTYAGDLGTICYGGTQLPKTFTYSRTIGSYSVCGDYNVENTATFTTNDTAATGSDNWNVAVNVPCQTGCTLTIGYWKTHAGFGPQADMVTPLLSQYLGTNLLGAPIGKSAKVDTAAKAVQYLQFYGSNNVFDASNGINKLYAQLLAAKLNIASGADKTSVSATILSADMFLTSKDSLSWGSLSKADKTKVLNWVAALDGFNNGLTGPGHCSQ